MLIIIFGTLGYLVIAGITAAILGNTITEDVCGIALGFFWPITAPLIILLAIVAGVEKFTNYIIKKIIQ